MRVTTAIRPDKRWKRKGSNLFPLSIRITQYRKPRFFPVGVDISIKDFDKLFDQRVGKELADIREKAEKRHDDAKSIIKQLDPFSFEDFGEEFYRDLPRRKKKQKPKRKTKAFQSSPFIQLPTVKASEKADQKIELNNKKFKNQYGKKKYPQKKSEIDYAALGQVAKLYGETIKLCELQKRIGNLYNLFNSLISLLSFKKNLRFKEITSMFLEQYQAWMEAKGNSLSTIGFYLRPLRTIFNRAIKNKIIKQELYPFGRDRFVIPSTENVKKAMSILSLQKLYYHKPRCIQEEMCLDYWFFIYFGNGMNMKDLALLKYSKIKGDFIYFFRAKTERTAKGKRKLIPVYLSEDIRRIIDKWGNKDKSPDNYIFPILQNGIDPYGLRDLVQLFIKRVNCWMEVIAKSEGVDEEVLTMAGRHTFATQLRDANVNKEFIRDSLGQIDPESIDHYFGLFQNSSHIEYVSNLESFKIREDNSSQSEDDQIKSLLIQLNVLLNNKNKQHAA